MKSGTKIVLSVAICAAVFFLWLSELEAQITFTDVSAAAGFFGNNSSWAAAWADYDRDGDIDVMTLGHFQGVTGSISQLWQNNGNGTFTDVTVQAGLNPRNRDPHGAAWGDLNNDGYIDLYIAKGGGGNELWISNQNGTFTDMASTAGVTGLAIGYRGAYAVDHDRDRDLDIFVPAFSTNPGEGRNFFYRNDGNLLFTEVAGGSGLAREEIKNRTAAWADFDGDGLLDVLLTMSCALFKNQGNGTFTDVTALAGIVSAPECYNAAWGDYDNDGDSDLYINMSGGLQGILYQNNGNGTFTDVTAASGVINVPVSHAAVGITWGDYDNDGFLDLYIVNSRNTQQPNRLFQNNGNGTFTDVTATAGVGAQVGGQGSDGIFIDYNNDGFLDLFVCNGEGNAVGPYILYQNNGGNGNAWLKLTLRGRRGQSNLNGIGAKVFVTAQGMTQFREYTGQHYMAQDAVPIHFGLGGAPRVDSLTIYWPSGLIQTVTNFRTNRSVTVFEPLLP